MCSHRGHILTLFFLLFLLPSLPPFPLPVGPIIAVTCPAGAVPEIFLRISLVLPLLFFPFKGMESETMAWTKKEGKSGGARGGKGGLSTLL